MISVNTLSGDDVLNAAEAQQPLTVHGSSSAEAGQTVTVTLGGKPTLRLSAAMALDAGRSGGELVALSGVR